MSGYGNKGTSLAKGPAGLLGLLLLALGVTGLIFSDSSFTEQAFDGTVNGDTWLGLEANGWTNLLFAAGGALLLISSFLHQTAKSAAAIVGLALGAVALIALGDGEDALGIFAVNEATKIVLGAAGAVLLLIALLPRVGGGATVAPDRRDRTMREPVAAYDDDATPAPRAWRPRSTPARARGRSEPPPPAEATDATAGAYEDHATTPSSATTKSARARGSRFRWHRR